VAILLVDIDDLLMVIILMTIGGGYFIAGYW